MKKILSLFVLMAAFCMVGFAQSAPQTAKKATLMGDNAQVKDVKTGQVLRIAKASKQVPANLNGAVQMSRNGVPSNSATPAGGSGAKKAVKGNSSNMKVIERFPDDVQRNGTNQNKSSVTKLKATSPQKVGQMTMPSKLGEKQKRTPQNTGKKQERVVPQNAVILERQ